MFARRLFPLLLLLTLCGCEQVSNALDLPDPKKAAALAEADGKAIGSACRHAGRSLEDCYALNAKAQKAAVFAGWREMNDYMMQNNLPTVPSLIQSPVQATQTAQSATEASPAATEPSNTASPAEQRPPRRSRATQ
ncbi:hypothetical protein [Aromatoleum diolicum]|uniref:Lipoprotein n=1 Tax=Aromatoleum diolicum TaxID=75796 RepID=A0ABX1QCY8_9RHOO|nr:hypothetical protein [Aromatoleum diolicum]NMG76266.1 hypothetical protein [Aromatoleum diolicum]